MSRETVVVDGLRTPYSRAGTELKDVPADALGRIVAVELLARTDFDPEAVDEVIFGNIAQPPDAVNVARVAALRAGIPRTVPAYTVNRNCAARACRSIVEPTIGSRGPRRGHPRRRRRVDVQHPAPLFAREPGGLHGGLHGPRSRRTRGGGGQVPPPALQARDRPPDGADGRRLRIEHGRDRGNPREGARHLARGAGRVCAALASAGHAARAKPLAEEIVPVPIPPKFAGMAAQDNGVRENQTLEALAKLKPYFDRRFGTVTAGNSSQITDGGAATLVMSASAARARGISRWAASAASRSALSSPSAWGSGPRSRRPWP